MWYLFTMSLAQHLLRDLNLAPLTIRTLRTIHNMEGRYYHVWDHALSVVSWVAHVYDRGEFEDNRTYECGLTLLQELKIAALFHDVSYDILAPAGENERMSAKILACHFPKADTAVECVEATAKHGTYTAHTTMPNNLRLFLDCDLAYMFAEPRYSVFEWLDTQVVEEYCQHFDREQVLAGRRAFLENMHAHGVFVSSYFRDAFEDQAMGNLARLLEGY